MSDRSLEEHHRGIIEEPEYTRQREALRLDIKLLDEAYANVSRALSAQPETFPEIPGGSLRRLRLNGFSRMPDVNVWFTFDDENVHLHVIEQVQEEP